MEIVNRKTWYVLDVLKFVFCIFVIALHTGLYNTGYGYYWVEKGLLKLAVPFFMVTTGYLLAVKVDKEKSARNAIKSYTKRLLTLLLVWETVSLTLSIVYWIIEGKNTGFHILLLSVRSILFYPVGALWYIQAAIIGMWLALFFIETQNVEKGLLLGAGLYFIGSLSNSYFFIVENSVLEEIVHLYIKLFATARNGLFYGLFMILLGYKCYQIYNKKKINRNTTLVMTIVAYILYIVEAAILRNKTSVDNDSMFLMLPLFSFCLVLICGFYITEEKINTKIFRNLSTGMYLLHRPVIYIFMIASLILHVEIDNSFLFIAVIMLTSTVCLIAYGKNMFISKYLK